MFLLWFLRLCVIGVVSIVRGRHGAMVEVEGTFCVLERIHYFVCAPLYSGGAAMLEPPHPISC
jgi:hypothetical protein